MFRFVPRPAFAALIVLVGCNRATFTWHPSLVSQVPDGTPVRFSPERRDRPTVGRSLDWQRGVPKLLTTLGDTVVVPRGAWTMVRLNRKAGHPVSGAIIGAIVGVGVEIANCPSRWELCGEENPTELLFAGLGALIGAQIKTEHWIRVRWSTRERQ
jgi:hypothetical protein